MKIFVAFALFNLTLALPNSKLAPKITVQQDRSPLTIPIIDILFPDGHEDKMILKRHFVTDEEKEKQELNCNFLGHLQNDREACLAVTGCPSQQMEFTSQNLVFEMVFKYSQIKLYSAACKPRWRTRPMISLAAAGILVPGPKIAETPDCFSMS